MVTWAGFLRSRQRNGGLHVTSWEIFLWKMLRFSPSLDHGSAFSVQHYGNGINVPMPVIATRSTSCNNQNKHLWYITYVTYTLGVNSWQDFFPVSTQLLTIMMRTFEKFINHQRFEFKLLRFNRIFKHLFLALYIQVFHETFDGGSTGRAASP